MADSRDSSILEHAEQARKDLLQKMHYSYLNQLQNMARELPFSIQQRLSYDLLSSLANSLLEESLFNIVKSLREVQQLAENNLSTQRIQAANQYKAQKLDLEKKHKDLINAAKQLSQNLPYVKAKCQQEMEMFEHRNAEEVKRADMKIILALDQKVMDQQSLLEKAGIPGFVVTNDPQEIRLQMYLLDFISRLSENGGEKT